MAAAQRQARACYAVRVGLHPSRLRYCRVSRVVRAEPSAPCRFRSGSGRIPAPCRATWSCQLTDPWRPASWWRRQSASSRGQWRRLGWRVARAGPAAAAAARSPPSGGLHLRWHGATVWSRCHASLSAAGGGGGRALAAGGCAGGWRRSAWGCTGGWGRRALFCCLILRWWTRCCANTFRSTAVWCSTSPWACARKRVYTIWVEPTAGDRVRN
jgi:hypothetical protein